MRLAAAGCCAKASPRSQPAFGGYWLPDQFRRASLAGPGMGTHTAEGAVPGPIRSTRMSAKEDLSRCQNVRNGDRPCEKTAV